MRPAPEAGLQGAGPVGGCHNNFPARHAFGRELARRIAQVEIAPAALPGQNPQAVPFARQQGARMPSAQRQCVGNLARRIYSGSAVGQGGQHGAGGPQHVKHDALHIGQRARLEGGEFRRREKHFQIRFHLPER